MSADDKTHYEGDGCQPPHAHGHPNPDFYEEDEDPADIMKAFDDGEKGTTIGHRPFSNLRNAIDADVARTARLAEQRAKFADHIIEMADKHNCDTCGTDGVLCATCPDRALFGSFIAGLSTRELRRHLKAAWSERMTVEELLCEALGYIKSDGGPDDPNGGGYITGEGDVVTVAMEAARKLKAGQGTEPDAKAGLAGLAQRIDMHGDEPKESQ